MPEPKTATSTPPWRWPAQRGDLDGLRTRADAGDEHAAFQLARLLARRGDLDGLRTRADAGDGRAAEDLAWLLAKRGDLDEAARILRGPADAGDWAPLRRWPGCWPGAVTWTDCAPGPTPATGALPGSWPICWQTAGT